MTIVGTLAQLAHLVLAKQQDVAGQLAEAAADEPQPVAELDQGVALGMPGHRRHRQVQLLGQRRFDRGPVLAKRGEIAGGAAEAQHAERSEEHTSELQSLMRISYAVFCLKKKQTK